MADPIGEVPDGYAVHRAGDTWLILDKRCADDLVGLRLANPSIREGLFANAPRRGRGRVPTVEVSKDLSIVLRRYRHGGLLGPLGGPLFYGPARALGELAVTARAAASGAPVPHVVCLVLWPSFGPFWSAVIGTREEPQAVDLFAELDQMSSASERQELARAVGSAVRLLHDTGVEHRDLQLRNVMVTNRPARRVVIIDLDRAFFHRHGLMPTRRRAANLGRLARSAVKLGAWGNAIGRREVAAFMGAYLGGRRELRRNLRAFIARERFLLALHQLSYPLRSAIGR